MFIIKNYDRFTQDYSAYHCKHYRKEFAGSVPWCVSEKVGGLVDAFTLILDDGTIVKVLGNCYIENEEGKTIDTIRAKETNKDEVAMRPVGVPQ